MGIHFGLTYRLENERFKNSNGTLDRTGKKAKRYFQNEFLSPAGKTQLESIPDSYTLQVKRIPARGHHYDDIREKLPKTFPHDLFELSIQDRNGTEHNVQTGMIQSFHQVKDLIKHMFKLPAGEV